MMEHSPVVLIMVFVSATDGSNGRQMNRHEKQDKTIVSTTATAAKKKAKKIITYDLLPF